MVPIKDLKLQYPFLFSKTGMLDDFELIMEFDLEERFLQEMDRLSVPIFALAARKNEKKQLIELRKLVANSDDLELQSCK